MSTTANASVLPSKDKYFKSLLMAPTLAWPTVFLFLLALGIIGSGSWLALSGQWPLWAAMLANGVAMYTLFSVAHDGSHRAISKIPAINEGIGRVAIMLLLPIAPFEAARWIHMQHHQFTNGPKDPDLFVHHGAWWTAPLRYSNLDIFYVLFFIRNGGQHLRKNLPAVVAYSAALIAAITILTNMGYGKEVLFLWFLPSRIGLFLISFVFVFLPHYPGNVSAQEDVYRASTIRRGWEWLLTPVLWYQNYHLIHHLYPTAPFYTYLKIWHLKYDELVAKNPAVQEAFGMAPVSVAGRA